jgi:hypothetical protein
MKFKSNVLTCIRLLLCLGLFSSCEKVECCVNMDTGMAIRYVDSAGNDLLNPATAGAFTSQTIDVYYLRDGQKKRVFNGSGCSYCIDQAF